MFYVFVLLICITIAMTGNYSKAEIIKKGSYFTCWLILLLFSALRYKVGTDYVNYLHLFELVNTSSFQDLRIEPFYFYLIKWISALGLDAHFLFIISSFLTSTIFFISFKKENHLFAVLGYILILMLPSFSLIRQALAVSFLILASQLLISIKPWRSLFVCIMATLCHYSAVFFLPLILLGRFSFSRKQAVIALGGLVVSVYIFQLPRLLLDSSFLSRTVYGVYTGGSYDFQTAIGSGLGVLLRNLTPLLVVLWLFRVKDSQSNFLQARLTRYLVVFNLTYLSATIMALQIHIFNRFSDLLLFVPILNLVYLPTLIKEKKAKFFVTYSLVSIYIVLFVADIYNNPSSRGTGLGIYPYRSILHLSE